MSYTTETLTLEPTSIGLQRTITLHRFGEPGSRPKIYLQAGLHAAEVPGMVVATELVSLLKEADRLGRIRGEIVVVPAANPIGLATTVLGVHVGRHAIASGQNYNRFFPDLAALAEPLLDRPLGGNTAENTAALRAAMARALDELRPRTEVDDMRRQLMRQAVDADYVYDLHAEEDAIFAAVFAPFTVGHKDELLGSLTPSLAFYADYPPLFDTALSRPWAQLAARFPDAAIEQACKSVTLELRGSGHVDDAQAKDDAARLFETFQRLGLISGEVPAAPEQVPATRFEAVEFIRASHPGIVVYHRNLGDWIAAGEVLAEIVRPDAAGTDAARVPVVAGQSGTFFARAHSVNVQKDEAIAKIAGTEPLADPKHY